MLAWHFLRADETLRTGEPAPPDGFPLLHTGPLGMCESGLHASRRAYDAIRHAPGPIVCRVECGGETVEFGEKLVCSMRTILWRVNAVATLDRWARECVLDTAHLWDMPEIVRKALETGEGRMGAAAAAKAYSREVPEMATVAWASAVSSPETVGARAAASAARDTSLERIAADSACFVLDSLSPWRSIHQVGAYNILRIGSGHESAPDRLEKMLLELKP